MRFRARTASSRETWKVVRGRDKPYITWEQENRRTRKQAVDGVEIRLCSISLSANNWEYWHVKSIAARRRSVVRKRAR